MPIAFLLAGVLVAAGWSYGAVDTSARHAIEMAALATLGVALAIRAAGADGLGRGAWNWKWGAPFLGLFVLAGLQALNPSHAVVPLTGELAARPHYPLLPATVSRSATLETMARLLAFAAVFWAARYGLPSRRHQRLMLTATVAGGFAMAMLVVIQRVTPQSFPVFPLTGRFVNENNYAEYANLLLPVALGLGRRCTLSAERCGLPGSPAPLYYLMAAGLFLSVWLTDSRAGMFLAVVLAAAFAVSEGWGRRREFLGGHRLRVWLAGAAMALSVLVAAWMLRPTVLSAPSGDSLAPQIGFRSGLLRGTLAMARERWAFGIGAGAFGDAFPYFQPAAVQGTVRYAHNDWAQFLAETGAVGFLLLGGMIVGMAGGGRRSRRGAARQAAGNGDGGCGPVARGLVLGLMGVAAHALLDFPLQIPAILLMVAAWLGLYGNRRTAVAVEAPE